MASSSDELSSSVPETGQQLEQSSTIAGQVVIEAGKTNITVESRNWTAERIGEAVQ